MGKRGPKKKPQEILDLRGTSRPDRARVIIKGEPIKNLEEILSNKALSILQSERERQIFIDKVNFLISLKMMEESYIDYLVQYSYYYSKWEEAVEDIRQNGMILKIYDNEGELVKVINNPAVKMRDKAWEISYRLGQEFGISPVSRQKIPIKVDKLDPLEAALAAIKGKSKK